MDTLLQDLRYAARQLSRNPGFALIAVLTLALGIGASSAIFSVVNGVLLRPLPFEEPERLIRLFTVSSSEKRSDLNLSPANFISLREQSRAFTDVAVYTPDDKTLTGLGDPQELEGATVSTGFFEVLGAQPVLGRTFRPEESQPGSSDVVVLGHGLWQQLFGSDPQALGKSVTLDGVQRTVVGVMPPGFDFPEERSVWTPMEHTQSFSAASQSGRGGGWLPAVARLRPGVTPEQAKMELQTIGRRLSDEFPETNTGVSFTVVGLQEQMVGEVRTPLLLLLGAVGLVLLIACANVAGLLLARAATRQEELAVRAALGARPNRLIRQFLVESLLLGGLGGALGLLVAVWGTHALVAAGPERIPRLDDIRVDGSVLAFTFGVTLLTSVLVGLIPAIRATRMAVAGALREAGRSGLGTRGGNRLRSGLVIAEVTLAVVLLTGGGLLLRSFLRLINVDPGFRAERVLAFPIGLPRAEYESDPQIQAFYDRLMERLDGLPGVEAVGAVRRLPLAGRLNTSFEVEGRQLTGPGSEQYIEVRSATPAYLRTMGIPIHRGREFEAGDREGTIPVGVISEAAARQYFPGEDPIGQRIRLGTRDEPVTIIGVVGDVRHLALDQDPAPHLYFPLAQVPSRSMTVVVRTAGDPLALTEAIQREIHALDPNLPRPEFQTLGRTVAESVSGRRFLATLLALFAAVALVLAAIGIFGLLSFTVAQRTREIGVRMALGARPGEVLQMVVGRAIRLVSLGLGLGILGALLLTRLLESVLYDVSPTDPTTFASVALLLTLVSLLASYVPARRATRVDPMVALRAD